MTKIILASNSPRRKELIKLLGYPFEICSREVEELINPQLPPEENVKHLAKLKAEAVAKDYREHLVIGADTMVCLQDHVLGKPKSEADAEEMLQLLSGKKHRVITGVAFVRGDEVITFCETTYVQMKELTRAEIKAYIATKEPMDKAGAYGIQGKGAVFIERIDGDYYNVVGLPIHQVYKRLIDTKRP